MSPVARLAVWSGPRNISTAMMRSWENRPDSVVVDEPLYAHYLAVTGIDHSGREAVLATGETDWQLVVEDLRGPVPAGVSVFYQKHMAHHLTPDIDTAWIHDLTNVLLIRDPAEVVASYLRSRKEVTAADIGLPQLALLYDELSAAGVPPPVIDAGDFLRDPDGFSRALCELVEVPFTDSMLTWPAGPRNTDGVWGGYWYESVWRSTGFASYQPRAMELTPVGEEVVALCRPFYGRLWESRWLLP